MRDSFANTLLEEAKKNSAIVLMTGDLGFGVLDKFQQELPKQFINAGVAEQTMMGMAAGIASTGKRVFVYSIGNFPTLRCLEQIRIDVCSMNNSVVVVSVGAGYAYGSQGYTHHALEDIAIMRALPNMDVLVPADPQEASLLTTHLANTQKPSYLRLGKSNEAIIHKEKIRISPGHILKLKSGNRGTILFSGSIGVLALQASEILEREGISVTVASMPFVSDIDIDFLKEASSSGPIVVLEEHSQRGGVGSAVLETLATHRISGDVRLITSTQFNLAVIGDQDYLRTRNGLSTEAIIAEFVVPNGR